MNKIEFYAGQCLDEAYRDLQENAPCYGEFNGETICSTDSLNDIYIKITGKTKHEYDEYIRHEREKYEMEEAEFKARIQKLTEEYRRRARGIIPKEHLEYWDKIVPIRLGDIYHGMELDCCLELITILNKNTISIKDKMIECLNLFNKQGHSGTSASIVFSCIKRFHPIGDRLVQYIYQSIL